MAWAELLVKLFHEVAWPLSAAWIAWYFRDVIVSQLPRVTKVGPVSLEPPPQASIPGPKLNATNELVRAVENAVSPELIADARKELEKKFPEGPERAEHILTVASALLIGGILERTYNFIFGSQIALLERLNSGPLTANDLRGFYDRAKAAFPDIYKNYEFQQWCNFMESFVLIARTPDGQFAITSRGRGFLRYVIDNGYLTIKPG
jgi:hypothetical protein